MADGSTKPIDEIQVGDQVTATDPETGESGSREVTHLWVHGDTLFNLEVDGGTVTTTEDHPFWNVTDQAWQRADQLDPGDQLLTIEGDTITVEGLDYASVTYGTAYNLTIDDIHTYHVVVDETVDILVHNTCPIDPYEGVRALSRHLQNNKVPRPVRKQIIDSFEPGTIKHRIADSKTFGVRFFGGASKAEGRYLTPTLPASRRSLALPSTNTMTSLAQFRIRTRAYYFVGRAAAQPKFGQPGGGVQYFVPKLRNMIRVS